MTLCDYPPLSGTEPTYRRSWPSVQLFRLQKHLNEFIFVLGVRGGGGWGWYTKHNEGLERWFD